jgi:hypothetical protein
MPVALTTLEELREMVGAVQNARPDAKESNPSGFAGAE